MAQDAGLDIDYDTGAAGFSAEERALRALRAHQGTDPDTDAELAGIQAQVAGAVPDSAMEQPLNGKTVRGRVIVLKGKQFMSARRSA
jgi:hypothetical protein